MRVRPRLTPKDAQVLADFAWRNADRLTWATVTGELLARLRILNGRDTDLAADATRAGNRLRDALLAVSPALERAVGERLMSTSGLRAALATWPLMAISEIPQSRSTKFPTPGVLMSLVPASFRSLFSGLGLVGA